MTNTWPEQMRIEQVARRIETMMENETDDLRRELYRSILRKTLRRMMG